MKQRILVCGILAATATVASAQSSVTLYGRIGLGVGKAPGASEKVLANASNSRLGVRGVEDLGGGLKSFFQLETRFEPDTGTNSDARRFWNGASLVGLQNSWGRVWLGRDYTPLFNNVALRGDPWGHSDIAGLDSGLAGIGTSRYDNTVNLEGKFAGVTATVQVAEGDNNGNGAGTLSASKRPFGASVSYQLGQLYAGIGYDSRTNSEDDLWAAVVTYDFGMAKLFGTFARGTTTTGAKHREYTVGASAPIGGGEARIGYDRVRRTTSPSDTLKEQISLGYHYNLSKRTIVFADLTTDRAAEESKEGYQLGLKHYF